MENVTVHSPTLTKDLRPAFQLLNMRCPYNEEGLCYKCPKRFSMEIDLSQEDGMVASHMSYPATCEGKEAT